MKKYFFIFLLCSVTLVGAGCDSSKETQTNVNSSNTAVPEEQAEVNENTNTDTNTYDRLTETDCPDSMQLYKNDALNFCYPENAEVTRKNNFYTIADSEGVVLRELLLETHESDMTASADILKKYANKDAQEKEVTCQLTEESTETGTLYTMVGYPTDDPNGQSLDTVNTCLQKTSGAIEFTAEQFFVPVEDNGLYLVMNAPTDPTISDFTEEFMNSLRVFVQTTEQ